MPQHLRRRQPVVARRSRVVASVCSALVVGFSAISGSLARVDQLGAAPVSPSGGSGAHATANAAGTESGEGTADHLLISEVATGGTSASDEFVEIYNPSAGALPLEGLEVIYVTASGATVTRKASWDAGTPALGPGAHLLIVNEAGIYATLGDAAFAAGLSATGGSVAIRIIGAGSAIDAVGWGNAASTWLEGPAAAAPASGHSLERLPGGSLGSGQDTDQNGVDFAERDVVDPQNLASAPIALATPSPSASASVTATPQPTATPSQGSSVSPTPSATPAPTSTQAATPTPGPTPTLPVTPTPEPVLTISQARAEPDGTSVTVEAASLTAWDFTDGGGYVEDGTAGIAVIVSGASFGRGTSLRLTGVLDDRYHQRTLRVSGSDLVALGSAADLSATEVATGAAAEPYEGRLVEITGTVLGAPTQLSAGPAFDVDDGSGALRVVVATATGIDTSSWTRDATVHVRGVLGQRDSTGGGSAGYRLQPRDPADVLGVTPPGSSGSPAPSGGGSPGVTSIADARSADSGASVTVEGVVTMAPGFIDPDSAVIADTSGAILLRLPDGFKALSVGDRIRAIGVRSTKSGMETLRLADPPTSLGSGRQPDAARVPTGGVGEAHEALLLAVRGAVTTTPRRSSAQNVYFDLDDGSGALRIYVSPRSGISADSLSVGTWVELVGVLAQETTGKQPERGYRLWPRDMADVASIAPGSSTGSTSTGSTGSAGGTVTAPGITGTTSGADVPQAVSVRGLVRPRLAMVRGTSDAAPTAFAQARSTTEAASDRGVVLALLLASAAVLLLAAGWLLGGPRLLAAAQARLGSRPGERTESPEVAHAPGLVALEVVDGGELREVQRHRPETGDRG